MINSSCSRKTFCRQHFFFGDLIDIIRPKRTVTNDPVDSLKVESPLPDKNFPWSGMTYVCINITQSLREI